MRRRTGKATIRDVALEAGVGLQTVSRVLNKGPYVKASTAAKIHAAIKKLGYHPNEAARMLKGQKARIIGLVIPTLVDPFFAMCAHAVQQVATTEGYMTFVLTSEDKAGFEAREVSLMASRNISGLLIIPSELRTGSKLSELHESGIPVVMLDRVIPANVGGEVCVDNEGGTRDAIGHLLGHGHRDILAVGYHFKTSTVAERVKSYRAEMKRMGLKADVLDCGSREAVAGLLRKRLKEAPRPTALFCTSNVVTTTALEVLEAEGYTVPDDIAVIGFDDVAQASLFRVPVTAVRQPADDVGRNAARLLLQLVRDRGQQETKTKTRIVLPTELVIRRSCGCSAAL